MVSLSLDATETNPRFADWQVKQAAERFFYLPTDYKAEQIKHQYDQDNSQPRDSKADELSDQVHHAFVDCEIEEADEFE